MTMTKHPDALMAQEHGLKCSNMRLGFQCCRSASGHAQTERLGMMGKQESAWFYTADV